MHFSHHHVILGISEYTNETKGMFTMNRIGQRNLTKVAETHRANLHKRLLHRLDVAKANGDENLIRILEDEMRKL